MMGFDNVTLQSIFKIDHVCKHKLITTGELLNETS